MLEGFFEKVPKYNKCLQQNNLYYAKYKVLLFLELVDKIVNFGNGSKFVIVIYTSLLFVCQVLRCYMSYLPCKNKS